MIKSIYADGGVILKNPSVHGGPFAFVFVDEDDKEVAKTSGVVTPENIGLPTVSNNYTELLACVNAMFFAPQGWEGIIYTDSFVTLCRLTGTAPKMNGIPKDMQDRMWEARKHIGAFKVILLDGHPTKAQLLSGIGKRGNPCSKWNVLCDELCSQRGKEFMESIPITPRETP